MGQLPDSNLADSDQFLNNVLLPTRLLNDTLTYKFLTPFVSGEECTNPLESVTTKKKLNAIFHINPQKASGSYGFRGKFFQAYWPIIGKEVTRAIQVKAFSSMGNFPFFNLHHIMIKHIPGKDNFEAPDHFWPISLNNTIYKAISKILVQRLRLILK